MSKVIAITLFRRPEETSKLFDALMGCWGVDDYLILISCDHDPRYEADCRAVQNIANDFARRRESLAPGRGKTQIWVHEPRLGVDLNKLFLMPQAFAYNDYVIFLEDDTPISK